MAKLKVIPRGLDEQGRPLAQVCEGTLDGKDVAGNVYSCEPVTPGKVIPPGSHILTPNRITEDGHLEMEPMTDGPLYEDQSEEATKGPGKWNSTAFRDGWERTFKN